MASEKWKPLPIESEHAYMISCQGRVKRLATTSVVMNKLTGRPNVRELPERILRNQVNRQGYEFVSIRLNRRRHCYSFAIAPMVCRVFNGDRPSPHHQCAHLDGNPRNNHSENLAWATRRENESHKVGHGTKMLGSRHHQAILTEAQVQIIRKRLEGTPELGRYAIGGKLAREYGVSRSTISLIRRGQVWAHI